MRFFMADMSRVSALLICLLLCGGVANAEDLAVQFPEELAGMRLVRIHKGQEALAEIDALHGKPIVAKDALIATYHGEAGPPAQVWVSTADSSQMAAEQVALMVEKMLAAEKSPFHGYESEDIEGLVVHQFQGMGQQHFIWSRGAEAWWISAPLQQGPAMLEFFLKP